ncbi:hypothetical protein QOT17_024260, partial [Balamuthia mandrillaris]
KGVGPVFCYFHCYSEKKSGKRPSCTSVKGTEAWKAAGCTHPALLEPVCQRNREKLDTPGSLVPGRNLCPWSRMVHHLQAHSWQRKGVGGGGGRGRGEGEGGRGEKPVRLVRPH